MLPTYDELITFHRNRLGGHDDSVAHTSDAPLVRATQSFRNQLSTLNSFLSFQGKTSQSRIGRELLNQFEDNLRRYIDGLPVTAHTKSDRRSHLRNWRRSADEMLNANIVPDGSTAREKTLSPFHQCLRQAIAANHEAPKTLARLCISSVLDGDSGGI
ncbi:hypothetical protein [Cupriavidus oxalaticus]|uniref:hypothetical protein n=1 Tax=Cupriavidus oxalaticus TaxID=96344 RepID=UPI003F73D6EA